METSAKRSQTGRANDKQSHVRSKMLLGAFVLALLCLFVLPAMARTTATREKATAKPVATAKRAATRKQAVAPKPAISSKQIARSDFQTAESMRQELNGSQVSERTKREYQRVMDAYRKVYYGSPTSSKADASVVAVAELLAESGRAFHDEKSLRAAIGQFEFLRREYPGSKYRFSALFTIGQIYKEDLEERDKARETFQEFLHRYPHHSLAPDVRDALAELDQAATHPKKDKDKDAQQSRPPQAMAAVPEKVSTVPLVTGIRHWSTPDYTRVAIDLESEVQYEAGRVPNPDRIFFDLHDTKLASTLVGKSFDVSDGFLRRIRVAQFQRGMVRVVLEVDDVSEYSAFLLPNPYRLIIDIHGRKPQTTFASAEPAKAPENSTDKTSSENAGAPVQVATNNSAAKPNKSAGTKTAGDSASANQRSDSANSNPTRDTLQRPVESQESAKTEVANLNGPTEKATSKPTSEPTVQVVAPREQQKQNKKAEKNSVVARKGSVTEVHQARPTSDGQRSLTRALGLKIGRIVVDAGHGGHDTGTIGPNGLLEKDLVLDVALRLGRLLQGRLGADVVYTRSDDTFIPLETRTAIANQHQADLFISVHANSSQDPSARGVETYYLRFTQSKDALEVAARENAVSEKSIHELQDLVKKIALGDKLEESRELASDVQHALYAGLASKDRTLPDRGIKKAPFIVLIGANMPSILAEISFVSNPTDERRLQTPEYRQKIAESLYKGVSSYVSGLSGLKVASKSGDGHGQP